MYQIDSQLFQELYVKFGKLYNFNKIKSMRINVLSCVLGIYEMKPNIDVTSLVVSHQQNKL